MALLGLVHPAVRRDAHLRSVAVLRIAGAAAADADRKLLSVEDDRGGKRGLDALGHAGALTFVHVGADDERELIAADAENAVIAVYLLQAAAAFDDQLVARHMAHDCRWSTSDP